MFGNPETTPGGKQLTPGATYNFKDQELGVILEF